MQPSFLKTAFDNRGATIICLLLALLNKSFIAWLYSDLVGDKSLYLLFAQSFLETGLMAEPVQTIENGVFVYVYNGAVHSPFYTLLAAPFLWLTKSFFVTQLIVSIVGYIIFFTGLYKAAQLFFKVRWITNLFILFAGFFLYPHELASSPKDTLAVAFVLWSVFFMYRFVQNPAWRNTLLLSFSIAGFCLTKLFYIPVAIPLLALPFVISILNQRKQYLVQFGVLLTCLIVIWLLVYLLLLQPVYHLAQQQTISLINDGTVFNKGFYPENLLHTYPFISSSVINTNFWGVQIEKASDISFSKVMQLFRIADVVVLILLMLFTLLYIFYFRRIRTRIITVALVITSLTMMAAVFYASLTTQAFSYKSSTGLYTFVSEGRTFLLPMITLQLLLFRLIFSFTGVKIFRMTILLLFVFECLHGIYFTTKQSLNSKTVLQAGANNNAIKKLCSMVVEETKKSNNLIFVTSDNALRRYALLKQIDAYALTNAPMNTAWMKTGSRLLIATHLQDSALLKKFPPGNLMPLDTIHPFIMHIYKVQ